MYKTTKTEVCKVLERIAFRRLSSLIAELPAVNFYYFFSTFYYTICVPLKKEEN